MLDASDLSVLLGIPLGTLLAWQRLRIGPPAVNVAGCWVYIEAAVAEWVADGGALASGIDLTPFLGKTADELQQTLAV